MNAESSNNSSLLIKVKVVPLFEAKLDQDNQEKLIDKYTELITSSGSESPYGGKNKDQKTNVNEGSQMVWTIALSGEKGEEGYTVKLDSIKQGGSGFFTKISKVNGTLVGVVTTNPDFKGKEEPYTILFHIAKKGSLDTYILPIDPKIRINQ